MNEQLVNALKNIEFMIDERASFNTGNEAKVAYQSLEIIKAELLKSDLNKDFQEAKEEQK